MSTKIYNAFTLPGLDMGAAVELVQRFKLDQLRPLAELAKARHLATEATADMDRYELGWHDKAGSFVSRANQKMLERQKEIGGSKGRDPEVDFSCELALIAHRGEVYGVFYSEQTEFRDAWYALPEVRDFSYQNSTDERPRGVSPKEWKRREAVWSEIFRPPVLSPDDAGITINLMAVDGGWRSPSKELIVATLPSLEARAERLAFEGLTRELKSRGELPSEMSEIMGLTRHPDLKRIQQELAQRLVAEPDWAALTGAATVKADLPRPR